MENRESVVLSVLQYKALEEIKKGNGVTETKNNRFLVKESDTYINGRTIKKLRSLSLLSYNLGAEEWISYIGEEYLATHIVTVNNKGNKIVKCSNNSPVHIEINQEKKIDTIAINDFINKTIGDIIDIVEERMTKKLIVIKKEFQDADIGPNKNLEINSALDINVPDGKKVEDFEDTPDSKDEEKDKSEEVQEEQQIIEINVEKDGQPRLDLTEELEEK